MELEPGCLKCQPYVNISPACFSTFEVLTTFMDCDMSSANAIKRRQVNVHTVNGFPDINSHLDRDENSLQARRCSNGCPVKAMAANVY